MRVWGTGKGSFHSFRKWPEALADGRPENKFGTLRNLRGPAASTLEICSSWSAELWSSPVKPEWKDELRAGVGGETNGHQHEN